MRLTNKVLLATENRDKFEEFKSLFAAYPEVELVMAGDVMRNAGKLKFVETHNTYLDNSIAKARFVNLAAHYSALATIQGSKSCLSKASSAFAALATRLPKRE